MSKIITQAEINNTVWKACDTFRGVIDPSQYKDYILTFLFVKYLSDLWKDRYNYHLNRYDGNIERTERAMRNERFQLPKHCQFVILASVKRNSLGSLFLNHQHNYSWLSAFIKNHSNQKR